MTWRLRLAAAALCSGAFACSILASPVPLSVILISVDTLRADRLGCYTARGARTPNIDRLAQGGTLFSQVSALVPLTLPSHASLLSSTYPLNNGLQDNGEQLSPKIVTLATVMKRGGYRTAAFVGGFVMDRRFGLNQGFDVYDSPFDLHKKPGTDPGDTKRPGADVAASAVRWLDKNADSPFFLFLHLYDLHTPRSHGKGYEAELEYVDGVVGRFITALDQRKVFSRALVVFTSDHGEGLGDHGESTHGYFIYQSTLRVPLIFHWPQVLAPTQSRVDEPASLLDVAPTILATIGLKPAPGMQGRDLRTARAQVEVYAESHYAEKHFGCTVLRSLRSGRYKYIESHRPELYDLSVDPHEVNNLYGQMKPQAEAIRKRLGTLRSRFTAPQSHGPGSDPDALAALRSLGYLAGGGSSTRTPRQQADPKDRIVDFERYGRLLALAASGRFPEANAGLAAAMVTLPDVADIPISLGINLQKLGKHAEAANNFRRALMLDPANALAHFNLAVSLFQLRELDEAGREVQAALAIAPWYSRAEELQGALYVEKHDNPAARRVFEHLLATDPNSYSAHYNLGVFAAGDRNWDLAERHLQASVQLDRNSAEAHNALGSVLLQRGDLPRAADAFREAIHLQPRFVWALYNLGLVMTKTANSEEAAQAFRKALEADPRFEPARAALQRLADRGKQ